MEKTKSKKIKAKKIKDNKEIKESNENIDDLNLNENLDDNNMDNNEVNYNNSNENVYPIITNTMTAVCSSSNINCSISIFNSSKFLSFIFRLEY